MNYYKAFLVAFAITLIALFTFPRVAAHAQVDSDFPSAVNIPFTKANAEAVIKAVALQYGADPDALYRTLKCESINFSPDYVYGRKAGDNGTSYGVAQIHLPAHTEVTVAQASDPSFAIPWAAKAFAQGHAWWWTCWHLTNPK